MKNGFNGYFKAMFGMILAGLLAGCEDFTDNGSSSDQSPNSYFADSSIPTNAALPGSPSVVIEKYPAMGHLNGVSGRIYGVDYRYYTVTLYIKVGGSWFKKPHPDYEISIKSAGGWAAPVLMNDSDMSAGKIVAFLNPKDVRMPTKMNDDEFNNLCEQYPYDIKQR